MISPSNPSGQLASIQVRMKSLGMGLNALVSALPPVLIHLIPSNLSVTWQGNCIFVSPAIYVAALIGFVIIVCFLSYFMVYNHMLTAKQRYNQSPKGKATQRK